VLVGLIQGHRAGHRSHAQVRMEACLQEVVMRWKRLPRAEGGLLFMRVFTCRCLGAGPGQSRLAVPGDEGQLGPRQAREASGCRRLKGT